MYFRIKSYNPVRRNLIYICKEISIPVASSCNYGKCVGHIKTVINSSTWSYSFISIHTCSLYILLLNIYISRVLVNTKSQTVKIDGLKSICI